MLDGIGHRCAQNRSQRKRDGISSRCGCVFLNFDVNMICHEKMLCSCDSHGLNNGAHTYCIICLRRTFFVSVMVSVDLRIFGSMQNEPSSKEKRCTLLNITLMTWITCITCQWLRQRYSQPQQHYVIFFSLRSCMATRFLFESISQAVEIHDGV